MLSSWSGIDGDYWALIDGLPRGQILVEVMNGVGIKYLVYACESRFVSIYYEMEILVIVEVIYADDLERLATPELDKIREKCNKLPIYTLNSFGGKIAIFDSSIVGREIAHRGAVEVLQEHFPTDVAEVCIAFGDWRAFDFDRKEPARHIRGVFLEFDRECRRNQPDREDSMVAGNGIRQIILQTSVTASVIGSEMNIALPGRMRGRSGAEARVLHDHSRRCTVLR